MWIFYSTLKYNIIKINCIFSSKAFYLVYFKYQLFWLIYYAAL